MSETDDTTGAPPDAPPAGGAERAGRHPLGYYYDDGTGYEVYDPEEDEEPEEDASAGGRAGPGAGRNFIDQFPL